MRREKQLDPDNPNQRREDSYRGADPPVRVLLLISAMGGNIPTAGLLDDALFETTVLAAKFFDPALPLSPHDLVFNAIGDADRCGPALAAAERILGCSPSPLINPPARVAATGRLGAARLLAGIAELVVPAIARLPRAALATPDAATRLATEGFAFALLVRAPGFQTGRHFLAVDDAAALGRSLNALPGETFFVIRPLDARGADGLFRKYRVMLIEGALYPLHLAISPEWKVHYFTAAMAGNASFRAEEARFLADMPGVLGSRAMAALGEIGNQLGLDYAGVDFALGPTGEVLLLEANPAMAIVPPNADPRWNYRREALRRVLDSIRRMLVGRAVQAAAASAGSRAERSAGISLAGRGRLNRKPCTSVQFSAESAANCSSVSTPSAVVAMPRLLQSPVTARTIAMLSGRQESSRTND